MIDLARPGFLWAGALLALGPLVLHLLRPVERSRKMLPTSRFLTPDPKRRVRLHRSPDERILLLLRMLLCFLLGAAFAGVGWVGTERGVASIVVVDGGGDMREHWAGARAALARQPDDGDVHVVIVRPTSDSLPEIERVGPGVPSEARWAELAPADEAGTVRLAHLVRAARTSAERTLGYDSVAGRIVTRPSWRAWTAGTANLRERIWPARIGLVVPDSAVPPAAEGPPSPTSSQGPAPVRVELRAPPALRSPLARALTALGATVEPSRTTVAGPQEIDPSSEPTPSSAPPDIVLSAGPDPDGWDGLWLPRPRYEDVPGAEATGGATIRSRPDSIPQDAFLLLDGRTFAGAGPHAGGIPAPGATVSLLRVGGRPAAAARRTEAGCRVVLPLDLAAPIAASADLPLVLEGLLQAGCGLLPEPPGAEAAYRRLLEDTSAPPTVAASDLREAGAGRPLERWILLLALLVALAETWTSGRIETKRRARD